jgi:hypothetical protein
MVREAGSGGWLGSDDKQGVNPAMDLAETELARALARGSALGISKLLVKEAAQNALPQTSPPQTLRDEAGVPAARSPEESSKAGPVEGGR